MTGHADSCTIFFDQVESVLGAFAETDEGYVRLLAP
jgi:hypothetical protein